MLIRWMCGIALKDRKESEELRQWLGITNVSDSCEKEDYGDLDKWRGTTRETGYKCAGI